MKVCPLSVLASRHILPRGLNFWEGVKKVETFEISTKDGMEKNNEKEP